MEGAEVILPDFIAIALKSIPFEEMVALSETNKIWSDWVGNHLNIIANEYGLPYGKSLRELIDYTWLSANKLLKKACKEGDMRIVKAALKKKACRISQSGYYAAKHGHLEIVNLLRELGANDYELMRGAVRGDQLEILKTFDVKNEEDLQSLINFSLTTETSKVRDWFRDNEYSPPRKVTVDFFLNSEEQINFYIPEYILYYAQLIAAPKVKKHLRPKDIIYSNGGNFRYQVLLYVFARFDYEHIGSFLRSNSALCFNMRTLRYCFRHDKYVNLLLEYYWTLKEDIHDTALRYCRFNIVEWYAREDPTDRRERLFKNAKEVMQIAIRDHRIFAYLEKLFEKRGKMPIMTGLRFALEKDRPKMFRYLYDRVGNTTEVFVKSLTNPRIPLYNVKQSIETIEIIDDIFIQQLFTNDYDITTAYRNEFLYSIMYGKEEDIEVPFVEYLHEDDYFEFDEDYNAEDFAPKVRKYI